MQGGKKCACKHDRTGCYNMPVRLQFRVSARGFGTPQMRRTTMRPPPAGQLDAREAFLFGLLLSTVGGLCLGVVVNGLLARLALAILLSYLLVYTPLKQSPEMVQRAESGLTKTTAALSCQRTTRPSSEYCFAARRVRRHVPARSP